MGQRLKKILLTGGSGFIGKNIIENLTGKFDIIAPSHSELDFSDQKVVDNFFKTREIDLVIHAAGKSSKRNLSDKSNVFYSDMLMFMNLWRHEKSFQKMIILGSGAIYDQRFEIKKVKEDDFKIRLPIDEHSLYRHVCARFSENRKKIVDLRIFGIFGKYEDYSIRFISNAICRTLFGRAIYINQNRVFDYIYVQDLMPILEYFILHRARHGSYNIVPQKSVELLELANLIKNLSGSKEKIEIKNPGYGLQYTGDGTRLKKEIKGFKFTPMALAVKELYKWYSSHLDSLNKDIIYFDK